MTNIQFWYRFNSMIIAIEHYDATGGVHERAAENFLAALLWVFMLRRIRNKPIQTHRLLTSDTERKGTRSPSLQDA
jgi:hypothetical protein